MRKLSEIDRDIKRLESDLSGGKSGLTMYEKKAIDEKKRESKSTYRKGPLTGYAESKRVYYHEYVEKVTRELQHLYTERDTAKKILKKDQLAENILKRDEEKRQLDSKRDQEAQKANIARIKEQERQEKNRQLNLQREERDRRLNTQREQEAQRANAVLVQEQNHEKEILRMRENLLQKEIELENLRRENNKKNMDELDQFYEDLKKDL